MSTFLELVQDVERESGTIQQAQRLGNVVGTFGRHEKFVEWTAQAWEMIQVARTDWPWMKRDFEHQLVIGQRRYEPADLGITDFAGWAKPDPDGFDPFSLWDPAMGRAYEVQLRRNDFNRYRESWARGVHANNTPTQYAIDFENRFCVGATPDKAYWVAGEYRRAPQALMVNGDVPIMPVEHHQAIVWRALMLCGDHDEAPATIAAAKSKYDLRFRALVDATLPEVTM